MGDISPAHTFTSAGTRRRSLPSTVPYQPSSSLARVQQRPGTVPAGTGRGGGGRRTSELRDPELTAALPRDLKDVEREEWVKASWKKGECREEIKLIAEASGLTFDDARTVTLRLYNHFKWLPQLRQRSEQLSAVVGRERRLSLSLVRKEALAPAIRGSGEDSAVGDVGNGNTHGTSEAKGQFGSYIRGVCVICNEGSFDQTLDVLFRAYSRARGGHTITRTEMAAILAKHVIYEDSEDPAVTRERVYRWLKRQFIDLTASSSTVGLTTATEDITASVGVTDARRDARGGFICWDSARELLRRSPFGLETSLAVDLPCLSKDLWTADLLDMGRTSIASSLQ
ncbi:unnamed protein product [Scytosiphon promiscuus]